jgi:hypothetical protein
MEVWKWLKLYWQLVKYVLEPENKVAVRCILSQINPSKSSCCYGGEYEV